uniref:Single-stranded DNA binding protein n=1 Tax=Pyropia pulchra TaxID=60925 RepID=A0A141SFD0_9RHOD|nr:hypothetical protein Ppul_171 [Pyropia pulchra]AMK96998.1 hypothetical protein Ppul_171 [Pyropia pulchra]
MNSCILLVQVLSCKSIEISANKNQIIKLKVRLLQRKRLVVVNLIIWNKKSIEIFKLIKRLDYVIIEGKLHRNNKIFKNSMKQVQKDLVFSTSRILKYKSLLKNKDVDLFIK